MCAEGGARGAEGVSGGMPDVAVGEAGSEGGGGRGGEGGARGAGRPSLREVLTPEKFAKWRRAGFSYADIREMLLPVRVSVVGLAGYGRRCLPEGLRVRGSGKRGAEKKRWKSRLFKCDDGTRPVEEVAEEAGCQREVVVYWRRRRDEASRLKCRRCTLLDSESNPVDEESGLCLWCRLEMAGVELREFYESGAAAVVLGKVGG